MKVFILLLVLLSVPLITKANNTTYDDWIVKAPAGHASYCAPISGTIGKARVAAAHFASMALTDSFDKNQISGSEELRQLNFNNEGQSSYSQQIKKVTISTEVKVKIISEKILNNQACVLVKKSDF